MNKVDLLEKFKTLTQNEDIEAINTEVNEISEAFLALHEKEENEKNAEANSEKEEGEEQENSTPVEEDVVFTEFDTLFKAYKAKKAAYFRAKAEEEANNLKTKKELINRLRTLVKEEENIGKAFNEMHAIQEEWTTIGPVARNSRHEIQQEYSNAVEEFYYNINIYKELKEHDFHRNLQLKEEVIVELKALLKVEQIKQIETDLRALQDQWEKIGGTRQEDWERLKNQYWDVVKALYQKISDHYEGRKREREENLKLKEALIQEAQAIADKIETIEGHKDWVAHTNDMLEVQKKWKSVGFAPKKDNDRVWEEFRGICDHFFEAKSKFYETRNDAFKSIKEKKQRLIEQVATIKNNTNWKDTAEKIKRAQQQWQKIGNAGPKFEQKLWKDFRKECDHFFTKRDEHFAKQTVEQDNNLSLKQEIIKALEEFKPNKDKKDDSIAQLNDFAQRFAAIGQVPRKNFKSIDAKYRELMDQHYDALDMSKNKVEELRFDARIDGIKESSDAAEKFDFERQKLRKRITKLNEEIVQYENNLSFFTTKSKGSNPLLDAAKQNLENSKKEVEQLKARLKKIPK